MDIEELDKNLVANVPFDPLHRPQGVRRSRRAVGIGTRQRNSFSPLVQQLPKLWELFHDFGMTTLELNPIRMRRTAGAG